MIKNLKKSLFIYIAMCAFPLFAIGYNINFELDAGFTECFFSNEIKENRNFLQDFRQLGDYINVGGAISGDIVLNRNLSCVAGFRIKNVQLNYITSDGNLYANGKVKISYPVIQLPLMVKYSIIVKKTTDVINTLDFALGLNISYILGKQLYMDDITSFIGNFISPSFNVGTGINITFSHKLGPGKAFFGFKADINFIPESYIIDGRNMKIGNIFSYSPVLGYTIVIKEDKNLSKITEKNKRIKDISVD